MSDHVLTVIGTVVTVAALLLSVYFYRMSEATKRQLKSLDWNDLQNASTSLARRIREDGCSPVALVTPGARGASIANLLAADFDNQPPVYVGISTWKDSPSGVVHSSPDSILLDLPKWEVIIPGAITKFSDGVILVVDDFTMRGDFLELLKDALAAAGVARDRLKSATVATTDVAVKAGKAPDYSWKTFEGTDFYFPWGKAR